MQVLRHTNLLIFGKLSKAVSCYSEPHRGHFFMLHVARLESNYVVTAPRH